MKRILTFLFFVGSCACLPACGDKPAEPDNTASPEEAALNASCNPDQTAAKDKCMCGEIGLNPDDAKQWSCVGDIWTCLSDSGCSDDGFNYPKWGYLGSKAPGKIPQMPADPTGYALKTMNIPTSTTNLEHRLIWNCEASTCMCGGVQIDNGANCIDETTPIFGGVVCGGTVCQMADTCKDGQCWCGETPQTAENVSNYKCENGAPVCSNLDGCACNGRICPINAICDVNGCRCGVQKLDNLRDANKYGCRDSKVMCITSGGCACGESICPEGSFCNNGQCLCGDNAIADLKQAGKYKCLDNQLKCADPNGCACGDGRCPQNGICSDGKCLCGDTAISEDLEIGGYVCEKNDVICTQKNGCQCGEGYTPYKGRCVSGRGHCYDVPIHTIDLAVMNSGYICKDAIPQPICNDKDGCSCGSSKCPYLAACVNGKCTCANETGIISLAGSDIDKYICVNEDNDNEYNYTSYSADGFRCNNKNGCKCGDNLCPEEALCTSEGCKCRSGYIITDMHIPASDIPKYECSYDALDCKSEDGCICGNGMCPKNGVCTPKGCMCDGNLVLGLKKEDIGNYECSDGLICNKDSCKCHQSACPRGAKCSFLGCTCGNEVVEGITLDHAPEFECNDDGRVECIDKTGCTCGSHHCKTGEFCKQGRCINERMMHIGDEDYDDDDDDDDDEYYDDDDCCYDDDDEEDEDYSKTVYTRGETVGNVRYCPASCKGVDCRRVECTDCASFTCVEEWTYNWEDELREKSGQWTCLKQGGCHHAYMYYRYYKDIDAASQNFSGYPRDTFETLDKKGEEVVVCNGVLPFSALASNRSTSPTLTDSEGEIEGEGEGESDETQTNRIKFVCDMNKCACGMTTCKTGEMCDNGKCSKYAGCPYTDKIEDSRFYCHSAGKTPELRPEQADGYECRKEKDSDRHWYCNRSNPAMCICGDGMCPKGAYCKDDKCMCGSEQLKDGYRCENNKQICDTVGCMCGGEPLRMDYQCSLHDNQICTNEDGCICGEGKTAKGDICVKDKNRCASGSTNDGCLCGGSPLKKYYKCVASKQVCDYWYDDDDDDDDDYDDYDDEDEDDNDAGGCECGDEEISRGDICRGGKVICGKNSTNGGCLCGNKPLESGNKCVDGKQICDREYSLCNCDSHACGYNMICEDGQCICQNGEFKPGCMCGGKPLELGYRCIDSHQVCQIAEMKYLLDIMKTDSNNMQKDVKSKLMKIRPYMCSCGDAKIFNGQTCENEQLCTDCAPNERKTNPSGYLSETCNDTEIAYFLDISDKLIDDDETIAPVDACVCAENDMPSNATDYYCNLSMQYTHELKKDTRSAQFSVNLNDDDDDNDSDENENHHISYTYSYYFDGWFCAKESCACGSETCVNGEQCSKGRCIQETSRLNALCPVWDSFNGITYENDTCYCNGVPMASDQLGNYMCENGTLWRCTKESCRCGDLPIPKDSYCLGNNLCGDNNCYNAFNSSMPMEDRAE